jgi:hypothetical protein
MIGQQLINYKDHFKIRHAKLDEGQMQLRKFVSLNTVDSLKVSVKDMKFPAKAGKKT